MANDIIAENQTERMIQLLLNGDADAKAQQAAYSRQADRRLPSFTASSGVIVPARSSVPL